MSRISWLIVHIYSWSIRLYPLSFREEFGVEMTSVFSEAITEATQANMRDLLIIFLRELRDYPFSLLRQHWRNFTHLEPNLMTTILAHTYTPWAEFRFLSGNHSPALTP